MPRNRRNPWFGMDDAEKLPPVERSMKRFFFVGPKAGVLAFGGTEEAWTEHNKREAERYEAAGGKLMGQEEP